jgi:tetratricopeptide (TPR) repeat protein
LKPESVLDIEPERSTAGNPISDRVTTDADVIGPSQDALSNAILAIEALPGVASASAHNEPLLPERTIAAAMPKPLPALGRTIALSLTQSTPSTLKTQAPAQPSATQAGADGAPGFERSIESVPEAELTFASPVERSTDSVIVQSKNLWQQQVQQAVAEGAIEQAEAILKQWLGAAPTDPVPRIWLARSYINNGFYRAAEPLLMTLTGSDANALLGLIYERTDRPQLAAKRFEALYQVNPENGRWLLFWAINSENSGQLAKSRSLYQTYLTLFELEDPALTQFSQQRLTTLGGY